MAKTGIFIDTSVFIEIFRGNKKTRDLINKQVADFYYSFVTKKELLKKRGLKTSDKQKIRNFLYRGRIIYIDQQILEAIQLIAPLYIKKGIKDSNDIIIAATALAKRFPLATLNRKHFVFIKGLKLVSL